MKRKRGYSPASQAVVKRLLFGHEISCCMISVKNLGVLELLDSGSKTTTQLIEEIGASQSGYNLLHATLSLLACNDILVASREAISSDSNQIELFWAHTDLSVLFILLRNMDLKLFVASTAGYLFAPSNF